MKYVIHTIMAHGQKLMPEVMKGVIDNWACLIPITSERNGSHPRENRFQNWTEAFKYRINNYHIHMDSDMLLPPGTLDTLTKWMRQSDLVIWPAKRGSNSHGLWAVKYDIVDSVSFDFVGIEQCSICQWFKEIEKVGRVLRIPGPKLEQVKN